MDQAQHAADLIYTAQDLRPKGQPPASPDVVEII
jgi:hypothetical protein